MVLSTAYPAALQLIDISECINTKKRTCDPVSMVLSTAPVCVFQNLMHLHQKQRNCSHRQPGLPSPSWQQLFEMLCTAKHGKQPFLACRTSLREQEISLVAPLHLNITEKPYLTQLVPSSYSLTSQFAHIMQQHRKSTKRTCLLCPPQWPAGCSGRGTKQEP